MLEMYPILLEKHNKTLRKIKFSSDGHETLSYGTVCYSLDREFDPRGVEHLWAELHIID
jgi:hypothetical protein